MSNGIIYREPACDLTDAALVDAFAKVSSDCADIGVASLEVVRFGSTKSYSGGVDSAQIAIQIFNRPDLGELRTITSIILSLGDAKKDSVAVTFTRSPKGAELTFSSSQVQAAERAHAAAVQQASEQAVQNTAGGSAAKKVAVQAAAQALTSEGAQKIQAATAKALPQALRLVSAANSHGLILPRILDTAYPESAAVRVMSEQLASFRDIIATQGRNNEEMRRRLIEEHDKRTATLFAEHEHRLERITRDLQAREEETRKKLTEKERELQTLSEAVRDREAKLDLQSERDARRSLRKQIQAAAATMFEKPDLSEQAKASFERVAKACRWTIVGAVVLLAVALFVPPVLELGLEKVLSSELIWLVWSMRILGGITLAAALIYYVSSLSAWSRQVSSIELRSKQFALDIDRASWLVEMALEYEKEGKALPTAMVESFTRGLFDGGAQAAQHDAPSASLLHLIQNAESLKVGAAGAELTLTGKQIRKADAQASRGE